ncbi:MAG: T9SS type A sorting domain-containing protein, partial [Gelidibacter sp.]
IDHCSLSWASDELFDVQSMGGANKVKNVTLQNSLLAECGKGTLTGSGTARISYYKNLFAFNYERNTKPGNENSSEQSSEVINNIFYGFVRATSGTSGIKLTHQNNIYKASNQVTINSTEIVSWNDGVGANADSYLTISGNVIPSGMVNYASQWTPYLHAAPFDSSGMPLLPTSSLETEILPNVGCSIPSRDAVDTRIINSYNAGNGPLVTSGSYPTINGGTAPTDSDNDGMPDTWEVANGLNPNNASDRNIVQPDGYTNLEYYLNGMTLQTTGITANAGPDVSICEGSSTTLTASGGSSYLWNTGATTASITVNPSNTTTYTVTAFDATGNNSDTDDVTVTIKPIPNVNAGIDVTIIAGNSATLTATGATSYLWNTGATTASINVNPLSVTTYTVTGTTNGCENSDSVTVFLIDTNVNANAGPDVSICEGSSTTLTATGGASYIWSTGATTSSITVNPASTTTYSVTALGLLGINSDTDQVTVTVDPLPTVGAGADVTINAGESTTLTATGGSTYVWSTGATTPSISVSPAATTTYTVTGTTANGCSASDTVTVTVLTGGTVTASAGPDVSICEGDSTTLTATGGASYLWSTGATTSSITVNPNSTTTYSVTAYNATGTDSDTDQVTVTVDPLPTADAGSDVSTCRGTSVTLTATGGSAYLWSTGATTPSITVNPNSTTTYSVEVAQNGCSDTDQVTVTVDPLPTVGAGADVTINAGESTTLTATGGGTYVWSTGATTPSISVSPAATTTYTVTGTTANGCSASDTVTVTVIEDTVTANAGENRTICNGYSVTLTATGGESYLWSTGATTQSITVSPGNTTTYSVTAFNGTAQDTDDVTVFVNPNPVVNITNGSEVTILEGEYVTLSATGANTYEWNNGATLPNIAVNPNSTTTYSVTGYINNCSDVKDVVVNVVPQVVAFAGDNQTVCLNETVTLTATGGDEFLWSTGETTASISVTPTEDTEYSVTVYNELDYDTAEVMVFVNDCSVIENPEDSETYEFLVYPNPTSGNLNIKISGVLMVSSIAMYDLSGKMLFNETISEADGELGFERTLDLSNYSDGLYLLKLVDNQKTITKKIVVNR